MLTRKPQIYVFERLSKAQIEKVEIVKGSYEDYEGSNVNEGK